MGDTTAISWTDKTFNAVWGCKEVSPGCAHCFAKTLANRWGWDVWRSQPRREFGEAHWAMPLKWNAEAEKRGEPFKVFCGSMFDWREDHPQVDEAVPRIHELWRRTPWLQWQMLTKRANRLQAGLPDDWGDEGYPNVWLGVSIESDDYVWRAETLAEIPAVVRFISYEPALGPVPSLNLERIDWLIYGGESGPKFRPEDKQWARDALALCRHHGTAFLHKQSAAFRNEQGVELDGVIYHEFPTPRSVAA